MSRKAVIVAMAADGNDLPMTSRELRTVVDGLCFPECPRWHDGELWFSDQHAGEVLRADPSSGKTDVVIEVPGQPSGLGFLPDGRLLVISMHERRLYRLEPGGLQLHADLSAVATFHCNDMVVDTAGRAYCGNFGFDFEAGAPPVSAVLALVDPDGTVRVVADDLGFPNGTVITPDGRTLIVAESFGARLTAFDIDAGGSLTNRRVFATIENAVPDGICLDADGAVWVASPFGHVVLRIEEGGNVTDRVDIGAHNAYACMLGGTDRRTLFICAAPTHAAAETRAARAGAILAVDVDVPGAGLP
jgi:sugar lactone lactonase YvrE